MLWVDDDFISAEDLQTMDSEIEAVSQTESISLSGNSGVIRRAKEAAQAILGRFMSFSSFSPGDLTFRNTNLLISTHDLRLSYAGFAQIVISGEAEDSWSPIKRWTVAKTLLEFYRMAKNKDGDRYSDRFDSMHSLIEEDFWPNFKRRGIPIILNPLVAPGAIMERAGRFTTSNFSNIGTPGIIEVDYNFAITWVGSQYVNGNSKFNSESYRSNRITWTTKQNTVVSISILGLTPPNGEQPEFTKSYSRYSPLAAVGWNVWAGDPDSPDKIMYRQNATVIPISQQTFQFPTAPVLTGEQLDLGQFQDFELSVKTELQRC